MNVNVKSVQALSEKLEAGLAGAFEAHPALDPQLVMRVGYTSSLARLTTHDSHLATCSV